ncbi:DsbA family oxidoreductase [Miniphocaeibacter massiliensis]|uniref:DsbA family oxidoreductase n=1 Tax=Miniphocaeibacter massiliensis TaxID=2041841 RepID=UPI000C1C2775|nr:DsbA family oxidoreductase [Miniphocaeibacter massiliensis]
MNKKIKIDIYSDYVCPFCYMGKTNLYNAIRELKMEDQVEINFKTYQLDENAKIDNHKTKYDSIVENSEKPIEITIAEIKEIEEQAKDIGLDYNYDIMLTANTKKAHKLTKYASIKGKQKEFVDMVMQMYFTNGANLNSDEQLVEMVEKVGLDIREAEEVLKTDKFEDEIAKDKYDAFQYQVKSVPFFIFEDRYGAPGKQNKEVFIEALQKIKEFNKENH